MTYNPSNVISNTVSNGCANGGQVYSGNMPLTASQPQVVDFRPLIYNNTIVNVQGVVLDNSQGTSTLIMSVPTGQIIDVPAGGQAMMPVFCGNGTLVFTFSGASPQMNFVLTSFPVPAYVSAGSTSAFQFDGNGRLLVSDPTLDQYAQTGGLAVLNYGLGSADVPTHLHMPTKTFSFETASGMTLIAGAPNFYINAIYMYLTPDAAVTAGATVVWRISGSGTTGTILRRGYTFVAATPLGGGGLTLCAMEGLQIMGAAGENLVFTSSTGLNAGVLSITIVGGTTAVV